MPATRSGSAPSHARPLDWALLALLIALGGSSFTFIRASIETVPPPIVAVGRLWIAALALYVAMRVKGRRFPPFIVRTDDGPRLHRLWMWMAAVGVVGYSIPFLIFPWAQQFVESGLAGVYMAFMPLGTLALASAFADERLNAQKVIGFILGFVGVAILMGPEVIAGAARSSVPAQAGLLIATLLYAASAVLSRRAPPARPRVFSAGIVLMGAIFATPALLFAPAAPEAWSATSVASVVVLGFGPTALAALIIIMLIRRVGAGFMALANYVTPLVAVFLGALIYHERLHASVFVALVVIFAGVAVSQRRSKPSATMEGAGAAVQKSI